MLSIGLVESLFYSLSFARGRGIGWLRESIERKPDAGIKMPYEGFFGGGVIIVLGCGDGCSHEMRD